MKHSASQTGFVYNLTHTLRGVRFSICLNFTYICEKKHKSQKKTSAFLKKYKDDKKTKKKVLTNICLNVRIKCANLYRNAKKEVNLYEEILHTARG